MGIVLHLATFKFFLFCYFITKHGKPSLKTEFFSHFTLFVLSYASIMLNIYVHIHMYVCISCPGGLRKHRINMIYYMNDSSTRHIETSF